jgi:hypothetical protein
MEFNYHNCGGGDMGSHVEAGAASLPETSGVD